MDEKLSVYEEPKQSPGFLLWHISTSWRRSIEQVLKSLGLTHPQFVVLATTGWLNRNGETITQIHIGKLAGLDPNTNSQVIKSLEQKGLIKRTPSSDGRAKKVSLTEEGSALLGKALPAVETTDSHFFNRLTEKELEHLVQIFQKLIPKTV